MIRGCRAGLWRRAIGNENGKVDTSRLWAPVPRQDDAPGMGYGNTYRDSPAGQVVPYPGAKFLRRERDSIGTGLTG